MLKFRFTPQNLSHFLMPNFLWFHSFPYSHKHICHFSTSVQKYTWIKVLRYRINWSITQTQVIKFSCEKLILIQNLSHFFECQNCAKVLFCPPKFIPFFDAKFPTVLFPPLPPQVHLSLQYKCVKIHMDKSSKIQDKLVNNTNTSYQV